MGKIKKNKLNEDKNIFQAVYENSMDAILITSPDGNIYSANQAACSMLQMTEEEICDHGRNALVEIDSPKLIKILEERQQTGRASGELTMIKKDGTKFPVEVSSSIFSDSSGKIKTSMIIRDITERKLAEITHIESENKFRNLFESISLGVIYQDTEGRVIDANPAAFQMLGFNREQLLTKTSFDTDWRAIHEDGSDFPAETHPGIQAIRTGKEINNVVIGIFNRQDADYRWMKMNAVPKFRKGENKPYQVYTIFEDITSERRNKKNLDEIFTKYRSILNTANIAIAEVDLQGRYIFVNPAWEKLFGYSSNEALGHDTKLIIPDEDGDTIEFTKVKDGELSNYQQEREYKHKNGDIIWCDLYVASNTGPDGKLLSIVGVMFDITQKVISESQRKESDAKFRYLFEKMAQGVTYLDAEGKIIDANPAAFLILGITREELPQKTIYDPEWKAIHEDGSDFPGDSMPSVQAMKTGKEIHDVVMGIYNRQDSAYRWIKINAVPEFRSGETEPYQVFTTFDDITERKQAEKILKESEINYKNQANFLDSIIENSPFAMWISDANGYLIRVNQVLRDTLEIPVDLDITKYNILEDENFSNQGLTYILDDVFKNHKNSRFEMFWLGTETGEDNVSIPKKLWLFGSMYPITDPSGKLINVIFQYVDITERKRAELEIKESEEKFSMIFANSPDAIILTRLKDGEVINANNSIFEITGYQPEEFIGKRTTQINIWKNAEDRKFYVDKLAAEGKIIGFETEFIIKSGAVRSCRISGEIIKIKNEDFILGIMHDITEIKKAERELIRQSVFINAMTENQPAGIVACDAVGKLVLFNKAAKEWHGIDVLKIQKQEWAKYYNLYQSDGLSLLATEEIPLVKAYNGEKVNNYEMIIKAEGQNPRLVSCNGASFNDTQGNNLGAVIVMTDITKERIVENSLKNSESDLRKALNDVERSEFLLNEAGRMAKIGAWEFDLATQRTRWSDQVFELHAIPVGEVPDFDFIMGCYIEGSEEILRKSIEECITQRKIYELELRFLNARDGKLWVRAIGYPIMNDKDEIVSLRGVVQDITERKNASERLSESQQRYKTLFENQPTIIWEEDFSMVKQRFDELRNQGVNNFREYFEEYPDAVSDFAAKVEIIEVNETSLEILEADNKDEIIRNLPYYFDSDEAWKVFKEELICLAEGSTVFESEIPVRTIKGKKIQLYLKLVVHPDYKENLKRVLITFQDITELKQTEEKLRSNEIRFRELVNNLNSGIVVHAPDTTILFNNPRAAELLGLSNDQLLGKQAFDPDWNFLHEDKKPYSIDEFPVNQILGSKTPIINVTIGVIRPQTRDIAWLLVNGFPVLDNENQMKEVIISFIDITNQKEAASRLQDSEEKFRLIAENSKDVISLHDTTGKYLYVSPSIMNGRGYDPDELIGKNPYEFIHPDDIPLIKSEQYVKKLLQGESILLVYRFKSKSGEFGWFESRRQPIFNDKHEIVKILSVSRDISERKKAELAIQESEKKYKDLVENSYDLVWSVDATGNITFINKASKKIYGYEPEELLGKSFFDFVPKEQIVKDTEIFARSIQEGMEVVNYESQFIHKNGSKVYLLANARILNDDAGNFVGSTGTSKDVTETVLAREKMMLYQHQLETAQQIAKLGYWELEIATGNLFWSDIIYEIFGVSRDKFESTYENFLYFVHPDDRAEMQKAQNSALSGEKSLNLEHRIVRPNGEVRYAHEMAELIYNQNGHAVKLSGTILDITDEKEISLQLRESEKKYRTLLETSHDSIWSLNAEGSIIFISDSSERIFGYTPTEMSGRLMTDFISEDQLENEIAIFQKAIAEQQDSIKFESKIIHKNGHIVYLSTNALILRDEFGNFIGTTGASKDITDARIKEIEIEEYQRSLQQLTTEISLIEEKQRKEIAENIHDHLSQSLVISRMKLSDLQKENIPELSKAELQSVLNHISEALENSRRITYDLSPPVLYELGLVETMYWLVDKIHDENKLEAKFSSDFEEIKLPDEKLILIYRIIQELITNTVKHARAKKIEIQFHKQLEGFEITYTDDGIGYQPNSKSSMHPGEGGFGLFAVRERVKTLGGKIETQSSNGSGTYTKIYIPLSH